MITTTNYHLVIVVDPTDELELLHEVVKLIRRHSQMNFMCRQGVEVVNERTCSSDVIFGSNNEVLVRSVLFIEHSISFE